MREERRKVAEEALMLAEVPDDAKARILASMLPPLTHRPSSPSA